jgi:hypothetical protein
MRAENGKIKPNKLLDLLAKKIKEGMNETGTP